MKHVTEEVKLSQALLAGSSGLKHEDRMLLEDNLDCLKERLGTLGGALGQRLDHMRTRAHNLTAYQVYPLLCLFIFSPFFYFIVLICSIVIAHLTIRLFVIFCLKQTELQLLQTALIETKCQILQALAGAMDRPASKQMEVMKVRS